jgi:hypothetical protein
MSAGIRKAQLGKPLSDAHRESIRSALARPEVHAKLGTRTTPYKRSVEAQERMNQARAQWSADRNTVDGIRARSAIDPVTGCWYARKMDYGRAYRAAYGEPSPGLVIDHLCCNQLCANPTHMEAVTMKENSVRGGVPHFHLRGYVWPYPPEIIVASQLLASAISL